MAKVTETFSKEQIAVALADHFKLPKDSVFHFSIRWQYESDRLGGGSRPVFNHVEVCFKKPLEKIGQT